MDPSTGRLVPYRFFVDETDSDMCKLRKLANLFPDMKTIIELGKSLSPVIHCRRTALFFCRVI